MEGHLDGTILWNFRRRSHRDGRLQGGENVMTRLTATERRSSRTEKMTTTASIIYSTLAPVAAGLRLLAWQSYCIVLYRLCRQTQSHSGTGARKRAHFLF
jgi:hypothetical protein